MFSTSFKIVIGYILLVGLLIGAFTYTMQQMNLLTTPTSLRDQLDHRRHITHRIISQLYDAESIGQTLRTGKLNEYYYRTSNGICMRYWKPCGIRQPTRSIRNSSTA